MKQIKQILAALAVALLSIGCTSNSEYSRYPCRFVFNTQQHANSAALLSASNPASPGVFCKVSTVMKGGAEYFHFATNQGQSDDVPFTSIDKQTTVALGMNNGLIFGYGNLSDPMTFYGYDAECPNCFNPDNIPVVSRPLSMTDAGMARCAVCKREYNMNTGGNIVKGDAGKGLTRYHASANGIVVSVVN